MSQGLAEASTLLPREPPNTNVSHSPRERTCGETNDGPKLAMAVGRTNPRYAHFGRRLITSRPSNSSRTAEYVEIAPEPSRLGKKVLQAHKRTLRCREFQASHEEASLNRLSQDSL